MSDGKEGRLKSAFRGVTTILPSTPDPPHLCPRHPVLLVDTPILALFRVQLPILHTGKKVTRIRPSGRPHASASTRRRFGAVFCGRKKGPFFGTI